MPKLTFRLGPAGNVQTTILLNHVNQLKIRYFFRTLVVLGSIVIEKVRWMPMLSFPCIIINFSANLQWNSQFSFTFFLIRNWF